MHWTLLILLLLTPQALACDKGQPCGASCISWNKTCHKGSSSQATPTPSRTTPTSKYKPTQPEVVRPVVPYVPSSYTVDSLEGLSFSVKGSDGGFDCLMYAVCSGMSVGTTFQTPLSLSSGFAKDGMLISYGTPSANCVVAKCTSKGGTETPTKAEKVSKKETPKKETETEKPDQIPEEALLPTRVEVPAQDPVDIGYTFYDMLFAASLALVVLGVILTIRGKDKA